MSRDVRSTSTPKLRSSSPSRQISHNLPGLFLLIEQGEWRRVAERAKKHPREASVWVTVNKTGKNERDSVCLEGKSPLNIKCKALHHACHRLRSVHAQIQRSLACPSYVDGEWTITTNNNNCTKVKLGYVDEGQEEDPWIEACKAILTLTEVHPEAAGQRESRHGCLPLHLAVFSMCPTPFPAPSASFPTNSCTSEHSTASPSNAVKEMSYYPSPPPFMTPPCINHSRSVTRSSDKHEAFKTARSNSQSSNDDSLNLSIGGITAMIEGELQFGHKEVLQRSPNKEMNSTNCSRRSNRTLDSSISSQSHRRVNSSPEFLEDFSHSLSANLQPRASRPSALHTTERALSANSTISIASMNVKPLNIQTYLFHTSKREDYAVKVVQALLDAFPKGIKTDSEGGRLPLHTATAGRSTPKVIQTLVSAYPDAARHRNKDGYLPLHLAAHWGVSSPEVAPILLKAYPDATLGRNRWERTPLEEALAMAGENGRPNQVALVKCLRQHPKYWSLGGAGCGNSDFELFSSTGILLSSPRAGKDTGNSKCSNNGTPTHKRVNTLVDVDETIEGGSSSEEERECRDIGMAVSTEDDSGNVADDHRKKGYKFPFSSLYVFRKNHGFTTNGLRVQTSPLPASGECFSTKKDNSQAMERAHSSQVTRSRTEDLGTLIKALDWSAVLARCKAHPIEISIALQIVCRGGYMARMTTLHQACERSPPKEVIEVMVETCPQALGKAKDPGGQLALHAACTWHTCLEVVTLLIAANPAAAKVRDELGNLPLHCACFSGASEEVVESLLCVYPRGVTVRNRQGSSPVDVTRRLRHLNRKSVLEIMGRFSAEWLRKRMTTENSDYNLLSDPSPGANKEKNYVPMPESAPILTPVRSKPSRRCGFGKTKNGSGSNVGIEVQIRGGNDSAEVDDCGDDMLWV